MIKAWNKLADSINAKVQRERIVIAVLVLTLVYGIFDFMLLAPAIKQKNELKARMDALQVEMKKTSAMEQVLARALSSDPHAAKKKEIRELELKLKTVENNLQNLSVGLISANSLPQALHDVLNSVGSLKLIGMQTKNTSRLTLLSSENSFEIQETAQTNAALPAEAQRYLDMVEAEKDKAEKNATAGKTRIEPKQVGVFKHVVIIEIEGSYFDVLAYLLALEKLPWKVYWEALDYSVSAYPLARVVIEVYTLSTEQGVLGV